MQPPQVLIVGSGPAGLVLAISLLKNGVPVHIIEKDAQHHIGERGRVIMPRVMEIYYFLGVFDDIKNAGARWPYIQFFDPEDPYRVKSTEIMLEEVEPTPAFPITKGVMLGQWQHQSILRSHVEALGGNIELATALVGIEQTESGAIALISTSINGEEVTQKDSFRYIIGADGARSTVRKSLNVDFIGETREEGKLYVVDAEIEGIEKILEFRLWGGPQKTMVVLMPTSRPRVFQIIMSGPNVDFHALRNSKGVEAFQAELRAHTRRSELEVVEITWQAEWRPNLRILKQFRVGNVFIIGDAAHVQSPAGAQGMNAAIQDAFNLGWKLACTLKGRAAPSLLDSYEAERLPANAEMLKVTAELHGETYLKDAGYAGFSAAGTTPPAANKINPWFRPRELFQLDLNYRWSPVIFDERFESVIKSNQYNVYGTKKDNGCVRAGDRAPDAPGLIALATAAAGLGERAPIRLFAIIKPTLHTVLIFSTLHFSGETRAWTLDLLKNLAPGLVCTALVFPSSASVDSGDLSAFDADYVLKDAEENAFKSYGVFGNAVVVVIVRPDGMIGAFATTARGIENYFSVVCGSK